MGQKQCNELLADSLKAKRKEVLSVGADKRAKLAAELRETKAKVEAVKDLYSNPMTILKASTLGNEHRGAYLHDLSASGPVEIEQALRRAVLTG